MIEGQNLIDQARHVAEEDGKVNEFDRAMETVHRITGAQNNRSLRVSHDHSLPKHSILAVIVKSDGSHFYTIGIVRHSDGSWSAHS